MRLNTKVNIYLLSILLVMAGLTLLVGTIGINRIVKTLSIELLELNIQQMVREINDAHHVLTVAGVVTSPKYIENAQNELIERFQQRSFGFKTGTFFIVNHDNSLIYHADYKPGESLEPHVFEVINSDKTSVWGHRYGGKEWLCVFGEFPQWQWYVVLSVTTRELFEKRNQIIFWVCTITALLLLITLSIASRYAKRLTNSIATTLECAKEVEHGNLTARIAPISSEDEVGLLQHGFNSMIAQREKTEVALRKERDRAQMYLDISNVLFVALDIRGEITLINQKGCEVLGYSEQELKGKNWFESFVSGKEREASLQAFGKLMAGGSASAEFTEGNVIIRSGAERTIFWNNSILKEPNGKVIGLLRSGEDITVRKKTEEEKEKLQIQLQHAYKMEAIGRLTGGIAHDFNNIIGIILGNTELTMDNVAPENPAYQNLEEVITACLRAKEVVQQLLNFSRNTDTEFRTISISGAVRESVRLMRATIPTSIAIKVNLEDEEAFIYADSTQIHQLMINLFTNAVHAIETDTGTIEVVLRATKITEKKQWFSPVFPGDYIELQIRDTGSGISADYIDRIFDPYFTTKDIGKGSGMGLSVVHGVVNMHGGAIHVESVPEEGSRFYILLPRVEGKETARKRSISQVLPLGTEKILIVDDEPALVATCQNILQRLGYTVEAHTNSLKLLDVFKKDPANFDLVITDMTMPDMTGEKLAQEILAIRPDMPIILCTGYSEKISEETVKDLGVQSYLEKPLNSHLLAETVRQVLDEVKNSDVP